MQHLSQLRKEAEVRRKGTYWLFLNRMISTFVLFIAQESIPHEIDVGVLNTINMTLRSVRKSFFEKLFLLSYCLSHKKSDDIWWKYISLIES